MKPCPCGYLGDRRHECTCGPGQIQRYQNQLSGPLLDRIDIHVEVPAVPFREISDPRRPESSAIIRERVSRARAIQSKRFTAKRGYWVNSRMQPRDLDKHCRLGEEAHALLEKAAGRLALSARSCHRVLKISRTIADLDNQPDILPRHVAEAIQYRRSAPRLT